MVVFYGCRPAHASHAQSKQSRMESVSIQISSIDDGLNNPPRLLRLQFDRDRLAPSVAEMCGDDIDVVNFGDFITLQFPEKASGEYEALRDALWRPGKGERPQSFPKHADFLSDLLLKHRTRHPEKTADTHAPPSPVAKRSPYFPVNSLSPSAHPARSAMAGMESTVSRAAAISPSRSLSVSKPLSTASTEVSPVNMYGSSRMTARLRSANVAAAAAVSVSREVIPIEDTPRIRRSRQYVNRMQFSLSGADAHRVEAGKWRQTMRKRFAKRRKNGRRAFLGVCVCVCGCVCVMVCV
jgi:hypothetical protein